MEKKLIVFDVDDTLYLERDYVKSGFVAVDSYLAKNHGIEGFYSYAWEAFLSGRKGDTFQFVLGQLGVEFDKSAISHLVWIYRSHSPSILLLDDAKQTLDHVAARYSMGVITDGPAVSQWAKLRALGMVNYDFRAVVTDDLGPDWYKPSIRPFRMLQNHFKVLPGSCIYVADNPNKDFQGPKELGWKTIRIERDGGIYGGPVEPALVDFECEILKPEYIEHVLWHNAN